MILEQRALIQKIPLFLFFSITIVVGGSLLWLAPENLRPAYAHANLVSSEPAGGQQVQSLPSEVRIKYTEGVVRGEFSVINSRGERIDAGSAVIGPDDQSTVSIPLQQLPEEEQEGVYTLKWRVLSVDTHTTEGTFFFIVGDAIPSREEFIALFVDQDGASSFGEDFSPYEPPIRWFLFMAMVVLVGSPIALLLVIRPSLARKNTADDGGNEVNALRHLVNNRIRILLLAASIVLIVAASLLAAKQITSVDPSPSLEDIFSFMTTTDLGYIWIIRLVLGAGMIATLLVARRNSSVWLSAAVAVGLTSLASVSVTSHSAAIIQSAVAVVSDFVHLIGAALWAGGLAALAVVMPTIIKNPTTQRPTSAVVSSVIKRFSPLAIVGIAIAGINGFVMTSWHVPDWDGLSSTLYGSSLLVKLGLISAAVAIGGLNRFAFLKRIEGAASSISEGIARTFVRSIRIEAMFVVAILFISGMLTSVSPAASYMAVTTETEDVPEQLVLASDRDDDIDISLEMIPNQLGLNLFDVSITRNGETIEDIRNVRLLLQNPEEDLSLPQLTLEAVEEEPDLYSTVTALPLAGDWRARIGAIVDGRFITETFNVSVMEAATDVMSDDVQADVAEDGAFDDTIYEESFQQALIAGAVSITVIAAAVLGYEFHLHRRERAAAQQEHGKSR